MTSFAHFSKKLYWFFLYDILIYITSWEEHICHLKLVFGVSPLEVSIEPRLNDNKLIPNRFINRALDKADSNICFIQIQRRYTLLPSSSFLDI